MDGRYKIHRQSLPQGQLPILLKNFGPKSRIEETSETADQRRLIVYVQVFLAVWLGHVLGGGSMWWVGGKLRWCFDYLILAVSRRAMHRAPPWKETNTYGLGGNRE